MKTAPTCVFYLVLSLPVSSIALASEPVGAGAAEPDAPAVSIAIDRQVWRGTPIRVDLPLDKEQIIRVPGAGALRSGLLGGPVPGLRVQVLDDHLYLLAKEPFAATRMIVQTGSGPAVLLDLAADARFAATGAMEILTAKSPPAPADEAGVSMGAMADEAEPSATVGYVALVRHAAQSLYAPPRLTPRASAIFRAPLPNRGPVPLVRGAHILATPVASWRAEGPRSPLWVTAVKLRNLLGRPVTLDPRNLRGQWLAAGFQHARLGAHGDETDTTTAYLISERRFAKAIAPWQAAHEEAPVP